MPTPEQIRKIAVAAREWLTEREVKDPAAMALAAAVARAYPKDWGTRENCKCGEPECDECPTAAAVAATIERWERESAAVAQ